MVLSGRIISQQKNLYAVDTERGVADATLRGLLKRRRDKPCVGDIAHLEVVEEEPLRAVITAVAERHNLLRRPTIANVDHVLFLASVVEPRVDREVIDRFLVTAEDMALEVTLVFNKTDLLDSEGRAELEHIRKVYTSAGCRTLCVSAATATGLESVREACAGKVSTMAGASGVGKSTLLNRLLPGETLRTAELSPRTSRGVHTTTTTVLLCLAPHTYIADTPGFAVIDLPNIDPRDVLLCFPELRDLVGECRFNNCIHRDEPGCVVKDLVDKGRIDGARYANYLKFCAELEQRDQVRPTSRDQ